MLHAFLLIGFYLITMTLGVWMAVGLRRALDPVQLALITLTYGIAVGSVGIVLQTQLKA